MFGYSCWQEYYGAARLADKLTSIKVLPHYSTLLQFSGEFISHHYQVPTLALNALIVSVAPGP